jgi:hypothetical protein
MLSLTNIWRLRNEINRHLISWEESQDYEVAAKEVLCITPNLKWAFDHRPKIFADLLNSTTKKYCYIVYSNLVPDDAASAVRYAKHLIDEAKEHQIQDANRLSILFLTKDEKASENALWHANNVSLLSPPPLGDWAYLPIPTDLVVYVETLADIKQPSSDDRKTFAVMSVSPITTKRTVTAVEAIIAERQYGPLLRRLRRFVRKAKFEYDIQLTTPDHYDPIIRWFRSKWDRVTS